MTNFRDTLIDQVKQIENIPPFIEVDRQKELRELFEDWRQRNKLVGRVVRGETTFTTEFDKVYQMLYGKWYQAHVPRIVNSDYRKSLTELGGVIGGDFYDNPFLSIMMNPVSLGALLGGANMLFGSTKPVPETEPLTRKFNRREFIKQIAVMSGAGVIFGEAIAWSKPYNLNKMRKSANYLDSKVREFYQR